MYSPADFNDRFWLKTKPRIVYTKDCILQISLTQNNLGFCCCLFKL